VTVLEEGGHIADIVDKRAQINRRSKQNRSTESYWCLSEGK
jgi:hypothetical protein